MVEHSSNDRRTFDEPVIVRHMVGTIKEAAAYHISGKRDLDDVWNEFS